MAVQSAFFIFFFFLKKGRKVYTLHWNIRILVAFLVSIGRAFRHSDVGACLNLKREKEYRMKQEEKLKWLR